MADTVKTVKSSGGDYSTLVGWEAGQQKSITAGNREIADCYSFVDADGSTRIAGWTVPSGAEIIVRAATGNQHTGTWGTGYRITNTTNNYYGGISIESNRVTLDGISLDDQVSASGFGRRACYVGNVAAVYIKNCLIKSAATDEPALQIESSANTTIVVNTVCLNTAYRACLPYSGTVYLYNCDFIGGAYGLEIGYATHYVKNCYSRGTTAGYENGRGTYPSGCTFTTCRHSDAGSFTGSTASTTYNTTNFTNVTGGSEDLSLPSGSALIDTGTDLSGDATYAFSTDILGATRSGTWEVGPFNYAAAATGHPAMARWNGVPGMGQTNSIGRGW